ncbi:YkvS family protein [Fictibacillus sp. WQ 8-8]|uniref:DUF2187 family protein n=1 Tax=Fictibacillus sp. WQ 8-8 TaxID=2938788 RepID=UPI00210D8704|nr:DUF2187 family protein [Fictibacillus sp. WQ 8-8]MCQ6267855.1 YkvS family protein [Fictibacillus sp. WQ 8-8]
MQEIKKAAIGEKVSFDEGIIGIVEKVSEHAVIVTIIKNSTLHEFANNKTVVSHHKYKLIH